MSYYLKTAWRRIQQDRSYALINLFGLAIGLCACMLTVTVILDDLSYDRGWRRSADLYRIVSVYKNAGRQGKEALAYANFGTTLRDNFPEVEQAAHIRKTAKSSEKYIKLAKGQEHVDMRTLEADSNVAKLFDLRYTQGKLESVPPGHANIILTEQFAQQHFPNEAIVGKIIYGISSYSAVERPYVITGVVENLPQNSYLRADAIVIFSSSLPPLNDDGSGFFLEQLLLMQPGTDIPLFTKKINDWYKNYVRNAPAATLAQLPNFELQPIQDAYMHPLSDGQEISGNQSNRYIFGGASVLLLLIACFNFMNLSMAKAMQQRKDTGVRKVLGAAKRNLYLLSFTETLLFFSSATILAFLLYSIAIPLLRNSFQYSLYFNILKHPLSLGITLLGTGLAALLSGVYPAWYIANLQTMPALKKQVSFPSLGGAVWTRKALIILQFSFASLVVISGIIFWRQIHFMQHKDLGFKVDNVLHIGTFNMLEKADAFVNGLQAIPGVAQVSRSAWYPTGSTGNMSRIIKDPHYPDKELKLNYIFGDQNMASLLSFNLLEGRWLTHKDYAFEEALSPAESESQALNFPHVLLTASTANQLGVHTLDIGYPELQIIPVGIIADFHATSLHRAIEPTLITTRKSMDIANVLLRINPKNKQASLAAVTALGKQLFPELPLQLTWLEDRVQQQYAKEAQQQQLLYIFAGLSLGLASLGALGLALYSNKQREKEIGIRKVLGASIGRIIWLLSKDYIALVGIAFAVAAPAAWLLNTKWLANFSYKIPIQAWPFAIALVFCIFIAFTTISLLAIKSARANPINSLRDE